MLQVLNSSPRFREPDFDLDDEDYTGIEVEMTFEELPLLLDGDRGPVVGTVSLPCGATVVGAYAGYQIQSVWLIDETGQRQWLEDGEWGRSRWYRAICRLVDAVAMDRLAEESKS